MDLFNKHILQAAISFLDIKVTSNTKEVGQRGPGIRKMSDSLLYSILWKIHTEMESQCFHSLHVTQYNFFIYLCLV